MTDKILDNELMTDEQLENITGGATGYIYYLENERRGGYDALKVTGKLKKSEVLDTYNRARNGNEQDLRDGVDCKFFVPYRDVQMLINNMSARGYEFVDYNKMR